MAVLVARMVLIRTLATARSGTLAETAKLVSLTERGARWNVFDELQPMRETMGAALPSGDPCIPQPCRNGARCRPNTAAGTYVCECLPNFLGVNCETRKLTVGDVL